MTCWSLEAVAHHCVHMGLAGLRGAGRQEVTDDLVSSCLRSLQYISEVPYLVEAMAKQLELCKHLVFVMRSCDYDADVTVKGLGLGLAR